MFGKVKISNPQQNSNSYMTYIQICRELNHTTTLLGDNVGKETYDLQKYT